MTSKGFVYVATGARYVAEALASVSSLRAAMPDARVALITDSAPSDGVARSFDTVIVRSEAQRRPIDKLLAYEAPYERCVFLDTDTHICGDLSDLFDLLDTFDLAAAPETLRGWHYTLPGVPHAFPEYNTGVLAFRRTPQVREFFESWQADYARLNASHGFVSDQPAFRCSAFRSTIRLTPLPSEYHFITLTPNYTMWNVRLIHGRGDLATLATEINRRAAPRAYVPGLGIITAFSGHRSWFPQIWRLLRRGLRVTLSQPKRTADSAHWTAEERRLTAEKPPPNP